jgi:predicted metal-dependent peptidase
MYEKITDKYKRIEKLKKLILLDNTLNPNLSNSINKYIPRRNSFISNLLTRTPVSFMEKNNPTACTDGISVFWNTDFFMSLNSEEAMFIYLHELWHIGFMHHTRIKQKNANKWNEAADYVINNLLIKSGFNMGNLKGLYNKDYDGLCTEEVYNLIIKDSNSLPNNLTLKPNDIKSLPDGKTINDIVKKISTAKTVSDVLDKNKGILPGEISNTIEDFLNPKLPWYIILQNYMTALSKEETSYKRPNRRYEDPWLPSRYSESTLEKITIFLDISASITKEEINIFNSESKFIKDTFNPELLTLVTFDTKIQDEYFFNSDDTYDKLAIHGRGGTCLDEVYKYINKHKPTVSIIFSDLEVNIPNQKPNSDIIWICNNRYINKVPYGKLIKLDN